MNRYQQVILFCLRDELTEEYRSEILSLTESDWHEVIQAADVFGVTQLIAANVQRHRLDLPQAVAASLMASLKNNTARNLNFLVEFQKIARAVQARNIPLMPLKGMYLATNLYNNIGERLTSDIDLLFPLTNLKDAVEAIETETGYHSYRPYDLDTEQRKLHHLPAYIKPNAPPLEIHWTILNPRFHPRFDLQGIWERSIPAKVSGVDVHTLSPNDLLIYLCAHIAYQHMFMGALRSLYDIKLAIKHFSDQLDWAVIRKRAIEWELLNSVYLTLRITDDLLGCGLPRSVLPSLKTPDYTASLLETARTRVFENLDIAPTVTAVWARQSFRQRLIGSWKRVAIPPSELAGRYRLHPNSRLVYLYYFVRIKDLFLFHGRNVLDILWGGKKQTEFAQSDSELIKYLNWWDEEK